MPWNVDGVSGEDRFVALHYNAPAAALIAQFERKVSGRYPVSSIYVKRPSDAHYWKAFAADDRTTARDAVTASKAPLLFFHVSVVTRTDLVDPPREGIGLDWSQIGRMNLLTGEQSVVVDAEQFQERHSGARVGHIVSAADDGSSLVCRIGKSRPDPTEEDPHQTVVDYSLCRLDLSTGDFEVIAALPNIFF